MSWISKLNKRSIKYLNRKFNKAAKDNYIFWAIHPKILFLIIWRLVYTIFIEKNTGIYRERRSKHKAIKSFLFGLILDKKKEIFKPVTLLPASDIIENLTFSQNENPEVSIIIPVFNNISYTLNCLKSISENLDESLTIEVIVVDDNSADNSFYLLCAVKNIRILQNKTNEGFIKSCNYGASIAKGNYLCFLNNDTIVTKSWLTNMYALFLIQSNVGIVGSKLLFANGSLQEAGAIIWNDGSGWNYGRGENPFDPKYNFVREVDYCSGAALLIKKEVFNLAGKFDMHFSPAYYEDTSLCFKVRNVLGYKVIYQPKSVIIHHEGITSGTSIEEGTKKFQEINKHKFVELWKKELKGHCANNPEGSKNAPLRLCGKPVIIIIDLNIPMPDKESGSNRLMHLIRIFKSLNFHVIFLPENTGDDEVYAQRLKDMGVEVLDRCDNYIETGYFQLKERLPIINYAWVCRPHLMEKYFKLLKYNKNIKILYDTVDLHFQRLKREYELGLTRKKDKNNWRRIKKLELSMAAKAHATIAISKVDKETLNSLTIKNVHVVPNIHVPYKESSKSFKEREGVLFIGSYNHPPNVDAACWLCNEIMPIVWAKNPDIKLTLLGHNPNKKVLSLRSNNVIVAGYIEDISCYFLNSKIFIAPLRYGAGMKGKIGQSLEFCLPVVTTSIGAEGMELIHDHHVLIADSKDDISKEILRLYDDEVLWKKLSYNSIEALYPFTPDAVNGLLKNLFKIIH